MKIRSIGLALILLIALRAEAVVSYTYNEDKENLLVSGVELAELVTITQANLFPVIEAKADDEGGQFEIRVFFNDDSTSKITTASSEAGDSSTSMLEVLRPEASGGLTVETQYARLQTPDTREGGLSRLAADSETNSDAMVSTKFKNKQLKASSNKETLIVFTINNIKLLTGDFPFVINLRSDSSTSVGSLAESSSEEEEEEEESASIDSQIINIADLEVRAYRSIEGLKIVCNRPDAEEGALDVCASVDAANTVREAYDAALAKINSSKEAIQALRKKIREEFKKGNITKKQAVRIIKKLNCALKLDQAAIRTLKEQQRVRSGAGVFTGIDQNIRVGTIRVYTKLKQAYEKCKIKAVAKLSAAALIEEETAAKFKTFIDDYELSDE